MFLASILAQIFVLTQRWTSRQSEFRTNLKSLNCADFVENEVYRGKLFSIFVHLADRVRLHREDQQRSRLLPFDRRGR